MTTALEDLIRHMPAQAAQQMAAALPAERRVLALSARDTFELDADTYLSAARRLNAAEIAQIARRCSSREVLHLIGNDTRPTVLDSLAQSRNLDATQARTLLQDALEQGPRRAKRVMSLLQGAAARGQLTAVLSGLGPAAGRWPHLEETSSWGGRWGNVFARLDADGFMAAAGSPLIASLTGRSALELMHLIPERRPADAWSLTGEQILELVRLHVEGQTLTRYTISAHVSQILTRAARTGLFTFESLAADARTRELAALAYRTLNACGKESMAAALLHRHITSRQDPQGSSGAPDVSWSWQSDQRATMSELACLLEHAAKTGARLQLSSGLTALVRSAHAASLPEVARIVRLAGSAICATSANDAAQVRFKAPKETDDVCGETLLTLIVLTRAGEAAAACVATAKARAWLDKILDGAPPAPADPYSSGRDQRQVERTAAAAHLILALPDSPEGRRAAVRKVVATLSASPALSANIERIVAAKATSWREIVAAHPDSPEPSRLMENLLASYSWGMAGGRGAAEDGRNAAPDIRTLRRIDRKGGHAVTAAALALLRRRAELDGKQDSARSPATLAHQIKDRLWPELHRDAASAAKIVIDADICSEYIEGRAGVACDSAVVREIVFQAGATLGRGRSGGDWERSRDAFTAVVRYALDDLRRHSSGERTRAGAPSIKDTRAWLQHIGGSVSVPLAAQIMSGWAGSGMLRELQAAVLSLQLTGAAAWETAAGLLDDWQGTLEELADISNKI